MASVEPMAGVGICGTDVGICGTDVGICGTDVGICGTDVEPMAVASVVLPGWLDCLTAIARVRVQRGLSVFRPDLVGSDGMDTAGTVPARAHWTLPDNYSQGCGSRLVFTRVSFFRLDRCDQFGQ